MKKKYQQLMIPILPLIIFGSLAEILVRFELVPSYLIPTPTDVIATLISDSSEFLAATSSTAICAISGLALSFLLGTTIAILLSVSSWLRLALYPYAVFFQTVPIISIAPLLVIWFGFGQPTVIASAFLVSIFPIIANTMLGFSSTDRLLIDLFKLYGASKKQILWQLRLPYALPELLGGLRIASGLAIIGAIVGEFIGGGGLGSIIDTARTQMRVDKVFAAVLISSALGYLLVSAINRISRLLLAPWHASEQ